MAYKLECALCAPGSSIPAPKQTAFLCSSFHYNSFVCFLASDTVSVFDIRTNKWATGPKMNHRRAECGGAALLSLRVFVAGKIQTILRLSTLQ